MPSALRSSQPEIWPENSVMHAGMPSAQPSWSEIWPENSVMHAGMPSAQPSWSENRVMQSTPRPAAAAAASPSAVAA